MSLERNVHKDAGFKRDPYGTPTDMAVIDSSIEEASAILRET
jgi:hypothetical protein